MALTNEVSPIKFQQAVQRGYKRMENFRRARIKFLQEYIGSYYDKTSGEIGNRPLNMIFNAVRVLIPTMVMNFPKHFVMTPYLAAREYANMLGLALDQHDLKINIKDTYRAALVDAIFTLGIIKTGLCASDSVLAMDDGEGHIDPGTVYSNKVDYDNFVVDPNSKEHMFADATFMGDRIVLPRRTLLESGQYNEDLVMRLPAMSDDLERTRRAKSLSMNNIDQNENADLEDDVEIIELWVPSAKAIVTVPASPDLTFDDFLRIDDYYGPDTGPYSLLALTPPVPGNPMPIPMVGIWYDLAVKANEMAKKIIEQASRQKDIVAYKRAAVDDAEEVRNAGDGETVAVDDPSSLTTLSFGGQNQKNEGFLNDAMAWFNMMAGNPEQVGGQRVDAKSATAANILQQNAGVTLEDMKDLTYIFAAAEAGKRAWYFHTDPLMQMPLTRRVQQPGQMQIGMQGQTFMTPPTMQDVQVILTPEARRGDFLDFTFHIEPESMGRVDSKVRVQQMTQLLTQIMPAIMAAAQISMAMGIGFSPKAALLRASKDLGIEWFDEVFNDPEFLMLQQQTQMMGPQMQDSKGQVGQGNQGLMPSILQNGQPGNVQGNPASQATQHNQFAQEGSEDSQRMIKAAMAHAFSPSAVKPALANANAF